MCVALLSPLLSLFFMTHTGCVESLSQSVFYSTFPQPVASAVALLLQPHGHNRGTMEPFKPLCVRLSLLEGQTADPRAVKGLDQLNFSKHSWPMLCTSNTDGHTNAHPHMHMTNMTIQTKKKVSFVRLRLIPYLHRGISRATMAFNFGPKMTTSNFGHSLTIKGLSLTQRLCYSSA